MEDFKVGDKVRCVETDGSYLNNDTEYTLSKVGDSFVEIEGIPFAGFYRRRFEKVANNPKFKLGFRVWSPNYGWGEVVEEGPNKHLPILVKFDCGKYIKYTVEGKVFEKSLLPTLFLDEVSASDWPNPPKPEPKRPSASTLVMNQKIMVKISETSDRYILRHFAFSQGEKVFYWSESNSSINCSEKIVAFKAIDWKLPE